MTTIRRIPTSKIDGNNSNSTDANEIRPYGEIAAYVGDNNKLELLMFDGVRTHVKSKVLNKGTFYGGDADSGDGAGLDTIKLVPDEVLRRSGSDQYLIIDPTEPDHIHIRAGGTIDNSNADLFLGGEKNHLRVSDGSKRVIISTDGDDDTNRWLFSSNGNLTLPDNGEIVVGDANEVGKIIPSVSDGVGLTVQAYLDLELKIDNGQGGSAIWSFEPSGGLNFPDGTTQTTAYTGGIDSDPTQLSFEAGADEELISHSTGFVEGDPVFQIRLNTHLSSEAQTIWGFGTNGNLTLPNGGSITADFNGAPTAPLLGVRLDSPEDGAAQINLAVDNNSINVDNNGVGIGVGSNNWYFTSEGQLTLPASGDILDSTGVNQTAQRVEGSWTVATGTATYSFTLPSDGTYVMWVKGNIPNGIITWNATASVSNTNVPAIGTQYAWNYTDGGSPILLTSIPDQIKGVAGTISTDSTYAGTTSNRFDFTIANASGASQTVFYGYTKI